MEFPQNIFPLIVSYQIRIANNGAILFYSGTPGPGNLVGSIAPKSGVDAFGNAYPAAFQWDQPTTAPGAFVNVSSVTPAIQLSSGFTGEDNPTTIAEVNHGTYGIATYTGPQNVTAGFNDFVDIYQWSSNNTGSVNAIMQFIYTAISGASDAYATVGYGGFNVAAGSVVGVHPGTGTSRSNPAVSETWQNVGPLITSGLWTTTGLSNPARFRVEGTGSGNVLRLDGFIQTAGVGPWPANATIFMLPTGYMPAFGHAFVGRSAIAVAANTETVNVLTTGSVQNGQTFTAAGQNLFFDGITFPLD